LKKHKSTPATPSPYVYVTCVRIEMFYDGTSSSVETKTGSSVKSRIGFVVSMVSPVLSGLGGLEKKGK
jgi:hypothetical protein